MSFRAQTYERAIAQYKDWKRGWANSKVLFTIAKYTDIYMDNDALCISFMGDHIMTYTPAHLRLLMPINPNPLFLDNCARTMAKLSMLPIRAEGQSLFISGNNMLTDNNRREAIVHYGGQNFIPFGEGPTVGIKAKRIVSTRGKKIVIGDWAIAKRLHRVKVFHAHHAHDESKMHKTYILENKKYHYAADIQTSYPYRTKDPHCMCGTRLPSDVIVSVELIDKMEIK